MNKHGTKPFHFREHKTGSLARVYLFNQVALAGGTVHMAELQVDSLMIPLSSLTHPYCWQIIYLGVKVDMLAGETLTENNVFMQKAIFDCEGTYYKKLSLSLWIMVSLPLPVAYW